MTDLIETLLDELVVDDSGVQGIPGRSAYVHIKWAENEPTSDGDMMNTPDDWLGVYSGTSDVAPTAYTDYVWYRYKGDAFEYADFTSEQLADLVGPIGETGLGITKIEKTAGTGAAGTTDTYTITYSDNTTNTFSVVNGANGRGVSSIAKTAGTGTAGTTDTYTISYSDSTTSSFDVVNGADSHIHIRWAAAQPTQDSDMSTTPNDWIGICANNSSTDPTSYSAYAWKYVKGSQGATGPQGSTGATGAGLEFNWNGTQLGVRQAGGSAYTYNDLKGATGDGISYITLKSGNHTAGTTDTYTITMTSGATADFTVYNGADGLGSGDMLKSAYDTNNDGVVNDSDKLGGVAASGYAREINGQTAFTDIVDADYVPIYDASATAQKKSLWSNIKSVLKTYFDTIYQATITGGATTIASSNLTASRALASNSSGKVVASAVTATELGYISGVTSAIQTQFSGKQATITGGATTIASSNLTASRALSSDSSGKVAVSAVTATELGYVSGVTSAIQTQLNAKMADNTNQTAFTDIADGDYVPMYDVSASAQKKTLWSNIKSVLKTYFDTVYTGLQVSGSDTTNSTSGRSITHTFGSIAATAYRVIITPTLTAAPTTSTAGSLGEIYVVKAADGTFTVYNTGAANLAFDWLAMKA